MAELPKRERSMRQLPEDSRKRRSPDTSRIGSDEVSSLQVRWLLESSLCPRILGHGGRTLQKIRQSSACDSWISPKVSGAEYRVMHAKGTPSSVAKFAGYLVRELFNEPMDKPSSSSSRVYNIMLLVPHPLVGRIVGRQMSNMQMFREKSAANLNLEREKLQGCDDRILHVSGVADAVHIAIYYIAQEMLEGQSQLQGSGMGTPRQYCPGSGPLNIMPVKNDIKSTYLSPTSDPVRSGAASASSLSPPSIDENAPQAIRTAYCMAQQSLRPNLRQLVYVPQSPGLGILLDNISRVTTANTTVLKDFDMDTEDAVIEINGAPEENALALYLAYRYVKNMKSSNA